MKPQRNFYGERPGPGCPLQTSNLGCYRLFVSKLIQLMWIWQDEYQRVDVLPNPVAPLKATVAHWTIVSTPFFSDSLTLGWAVHGCFYNIMKEWICTVKSPRVQQRAHGCSSVYWIIPCPLLP